MLSSSFCSLLSIWSCRCHTESFKLDSTPLEYCQTGDTVVQSYLGNSNIKDENIKREEIGFQYF